MAPASLRPLAQAATTQDLRCPDRWRRFAPDKVAWIESLLVHWPLQLEAWRHELRDDEDRDFLLYMVEHGISLTDDCVPLRPFVCRNYWSAYVAADQVQAALQPDIVSHRIFSPFCGERSLFVHALGAVLKTESTVRVIYDHSRPFGRSLNDKSEPIFRSQFFFPLRR
jgi:hypothetical protein